MGRGVRIADLIFASSLNEQDKKEKSRSFYQTSLFVIHALDVGCSIILILTACNWSLKHFWKSFRGNEGYSLKHGTVVVLYMAVSRALIFLGLSKLAVKYGVESMHIKDHEYKQHSVKLTLGNGNLTNNEHLLERLLEKQEELEEYENHKESPREKAKKRANFIRYGILGLLFALSCLFQIFSGVKVSGYEWQHEETVEILMICLSVLWINLEAYLYRNLIEDETREEGLYFPNVHRHPIFWTAGLFYHVCDLCLEGIDNPRGAAFRCKLCDYDICLRCSKRKDIGEVGEDLVRTDKGVKSEDNVSGGSYFTRALSLAGPQWRLLTVSLLCLLLNCFTSLVLPNIQGQVINNLVAQKRDKFLENVELYFIIMIIQGLFNGISSFLFTLIARRILFEVRLKLFDSLIFQDVAFYDGTTSGNLTSRLSNDINSMMYPIRASLSSLLQNSVLLIGGVFMCYFNSYKLSLLAFVTVGPIMFLWDLYGEFSKGLNRRMLAAWGKANSSATEAFNHIRDVKAFNTEQQEIDIYAKANDVAYQAGIKDAIAAGLTSTITGYLDLGTGVLILWFGGFLVLQGAISIGELVAFQFYWSMMNNAYQNLQGLLVQFTQSAAAAEKVFTLWDTHPDISSTAGEPITWDVKGRLTFDNVGFYYQMRPDTKVLDGFNLSIAAGSVCAFVGRSGGGKSTLIKLLLRFYDPREGRLLLDGRDYKTLKLGDLRKCFGTVAQSANLFSKSIMYNLTYGLQPGTYTHEDVITACQKAHCYDFIMSLKDQFETRCGESGVRISGGQGQRIAIARVFLRNPKVLLFDEATSALDEESQGKVQDALDSLKKETKCTIVLVAHRLSTVQAANIIAVIDKGIVIEQGSHAELVKIEKGVYRRLVEKAAAKVLSAEEGDGLAPAGIEEMMDQVMKSIDKEASGRSKQNESLNENKA